MNNFWRLWEQSKVSFRYNGLYIFVMGTASALTFIKGLLLAIVLPSADFGLFVSLIAISTFTSSVISFGRVEGFMKSLPRRWQSGDSKSVFSMADDAAIVLSRRTLGIGALAAIVLEMTSGLGLEVALVGFLSLAYSFCNIYSSAIRATSNQIGLAKGALARAALALVISSLSGLVYGWKLAIAGELFGALLGAALTRHWLHKTHPIEKPEKEAPSVAPSTTKDGFFVFLALTLVAAPLYLDRIFVTSTFGSEMGGKYGFLLIAGLFNSTLVGIMVQTIGPRLILQQHAGRLVREQIATILKTAILCISVSTAAIGFFVFCIKIWPFSSLWEKYSLDFISIFLVSIISFLRVSEFLDWLLLSHNAEKEILYSSIVFVALAISLSAAIYMYSAPFLYFLCAILASRVAQLVTQIGFVVFKFGKLRSNP